MLALSYNLPVNEEYHLVTCAHPDLHQPLAALNAWLGSSRAREGLANMPGYDFIGIGNTRVVS